jgi:hypothetical protein
MNFSNRHLIIILIIIIIFIFTYNYDVYIVDKNESICENTYIDKKTMKTIKPAKKFKLSNIETNIQKEIFDNLNENNYFNERSQLPNLNSLKLKIKSPLKKQVMGSVVKILSTIPTDLNDKTIVQITKYFGKIYNKSKTIEDFNEKISNDTNMNKMPFNNAYSIAILFLINGFNNMYSKITMEQHNLVTTDKMPLTIGKGKMIDYNDNDINQIPNNGMINDNSVSVSNHPQMEQNNMLLNDNNSTKNKIESFVQNNMNGYAPF